MKIFSTQRFCWFLNYIFLTYSMRLFAVFTTVCTIFKVSFSCFGCYCHSISYFVRWNFYRTVCNLNFWMVITLYFPLTVFAFIDYDISSFFQRYLYSISSVVSIRCHFQVSILPLLYRWCGWLRFFNSYIYFNLISFFTLAINCC